MSSVGSEQLFDGLRVVDVTTGMAGPLATMVLADHGADVVKVEPPGGEWARVMPAFVQWNRGKRSVEVNLSSAADRDVARRLVTSADVLIATDVDHLLERIGLGSDAAALRSSGLITCSITGFGPRAAPDSPRAYEGVVAALTGRMSNLDQLSGGHPGRRYDLPAFTAAPIASYGASQLALHGIVAALLQRQRTGRGQHVATSLLQGAIAFVMRQELARGAGTGEASIGPATHRGIELCFLTAECADGRYIQMCARQDRHFQDWLRAVGLGDVLDDPRYRSAPMGIPTVEDVDELEQRLRERMCTRTQAEWMRVFTEDCDVGADPFLTAREFLEHPDMVANDRVAVIDDPVLGQVRQLGPLVEMPATPARIERSAPALGASNDEVRRGLLWLRDKDPLPDPGNAMIDDPPLAGVTILEVAYYIAGPLAAVVLAELGARVIKIEPIEGDPYRRTGLQSAKFLHGKQSITLDLKRPEGQEILERLLGRSSVVVHSFRSAAAHKLGLDAETVLSKHPGLVHLYAAAYGSRGPQRDRAAFHSTPNALTGGGIKQAGAGNPPVNDSYADPGSALGAATAILFGLWARERNGRGQAMETTMLVSTGYIHSADMVVFDGVVDPPLADADQRGLGARYRLYRCAEGHVFVAAVQPKEWQAMLSALALTELADAPDEVVAAALEERFIKEPARAWVSLLAPAGVGIAVAEQAEFDEWLESAGLLVEAQHPAFGAYWRLPPKIELSGSRPVLGPACGPGEHSVQLLAELGYDPATIDRLLAERVTSDGRSPDAPAHRSGAKSAQHLAHFRPPNGPS